MHSRDSHAILVTKYFAKITHLFLQYSQTVYLVYSSVISLLNSESRNKSNGTHLLWTSCKKTSYEWVCMVFMHDVSSSQEMCKNEFSYYNNNECMAAGYPTAAWFLAAHPYLNLGIELSNDLVAQLVGAWQAICQVAVPPWDIIFSFPLSFTSLMHPLHRTCQFGIHFNCIPDSLVLNTQNEGWSAPLSHSPPFPPHPMQSLWTANIFTCA